jgi:hypothetical protein
MRSIVTNKTLSRNYVMTGGELRDQGKAEVPKLVTLNVTNETCTCISPGDLRVDTEEAYCDCVFEDLPNQMLNNAKHDRRIDEAQEELKYKKVKWVLPLLSRCIFFQALMCLLNHLVRPAVTPSCQVPHDHSDFSVIEQVGGWVVCLIAVYLTAHRATGVRNPVDWNQLTDRASLCLVFGVTAVILLLICHREVCYEKSKGAKRDLEQQFSSIVHRWVWRWGLTVVFVIVTLVLAWFFLLPFAFQLFKRGIVSQMAYDNFFRSFLSPETSAWVMGFLYPSKLSKTVL